jgi:putative toxin-antitoxin system antitoxin component (TIGR02293 family)
MITSEERPMHKLSGRPGKPAPARVGGVVQLVTSRPSRRARVARRAERSFEAFVSKEAPGAEKIEVIRKGVPAGVVDGMVDYLGVAKRTIFEVLGTAESTTHRLIKQNGRLDRAVTERVVRVADTTRLAIETFGDRESATRWLKLENRGLGGVTPLSLLDSEAGGAEVRRILAAIDYGGAF